MNKKRFDACIYLYQKCAVRNLNDHTIISEDPVKLATYYCNNDADRIIIFDQSNTEKERSSAIKVIKEIALAAEIPVVGAGNIKQLEDVRQLFYAGCTKVILNFSKPTNVALAQQAMDKFGKNKMLASVSDLSEIEQEQEQIEQYVSELVCMKEQMVEKAAALIKIPMVCHVEKYDEDKVKRLLQMESISGATGNAVNDVMDNLFLFKYNLVKSGIALNTALAALQWSDFKLNSDGMLTVVVQDYKTDQVLMVAYMNQEAYELTVSTGKMTYWSRSRNELWIKGDTSGHYQYVKALTADCDRDTLLAKVSQVGAACHTGSYSCFFEKIMKKEYEGRKPYRVLEDVYRVIEDRKIHPKEGSNTNYLLGKGLDKTLKELGTEAVDIIIAAKNPNANEMRGEISDFLYYIMVLMVEKGISWEEVMAELSLH